MAAAFGVPAEECPGPLSLAQAETVFQRNNPDLALARDAIAAANAGLASARERPNPVLSFNSSSYNVVTGLGPGPAASKQIDTMLQVDQLLERGGKRDLRIGAARQGELAAHRDFADQQRQGLLAVSQAYYDLELAENKLQINREIGDLQNTTVIAAQQRLRAGDISSTDLARLQVEALKAANDLQQSMADLRAAQVALAYLTGCTPDARLVASESWSPPTDIDDTAHDLMERPDVAAALARQEQAKDAYKLARAQRVRDITVSAQVEHYPEGVPGNGTGNGDLLLGFGFSMPLFIFNTYEGEIARADADYLTSGDALKKVKAQAGADLAKARGDLKAATDRAGNYRQKILPQAAIAAQAIEYAYQKGAVPLLDLLDARRTLHTIRIDAETAQADYAKALAEWRAAIDVYMPQD